MTYSTSASSQGSSLASMIFLIIELGIFVLYIAGMWKTFVKAGKPGWAAIVPIYNIVVMLDIAGKPLWWTILFFIPFVNLIIMIIISIAIAERFGKGAGFGVGLTFLGFIFFPILGFGDAQYQNPIEPRGFDPIMPAAPH